MNHSSVSLHECLYAHRVLSELPLSMLSMDARSMFHALEDSMNTYSSSLCHPLETTQPNIFSFFFIFIRITIATNRDSLTTK